MHTRSQVIRLRIFPLAIPLRKAFSHAAHVRRQADPIVVEVELADHTLGYGETLAREYVTGETTDRVIATIKTVLHEKLLALRPTCFAEALEVIDALPFHDGQGRLISAARAAVETALLDAYCRHFEKDMAEAVGWLGLAGMGRPGSLKHVRYSGVLSGGDDRSVRGSVRKMAWFGLRDFKLKVGYPDDVMRIRAVDRGLKGRLGSKATLRLDANGAWSIERAAEVRAAVPDVPIVCVEQPMGPDADESLAEFKERTGLAVMPDESLLTLDDGRRLIEQGVDWFNVRIAKNGGFLPSVRLAHLAGRHGLGCQLGCMVGETSILSAIGRRFLECVPGIRFAEGSYGRFLLKGDVVERQVRFGYGGKGKPLPGFGWGVNVREDLLRQYAVIDGIDLPL